jgi:hypothetical protein
MWTPTAKRVYYLGKSVPFLDRHAGIHVWRWFPVMTHPKKAVLPSFLSLLVVICALSPHASASWKERVLYSFQGVPDGSLPVGGIVFDSAGNLYGATQDGGSSNCVSIYQCGTVYQLAPPPKKGDPWTETVLYVFQGNANKDGASPFGGLVMDSAGNLYGTTAYGGTGNCVLLGTLMGCGTVFELSPPQQKGGAWTETVLYSFPTAKQGYVPWGDLVFDSAGNLYGATEFGGGHGTTCNGFYQYCGAVFELSPPKTNGGKWTEKVLYGFKGVAAGAQFGDGANPNGGLVLDDKGAIYGTTYFGGNNQKGKCEGGVGGTGCGIVFKLAPPSQTGGKWTEKLVHRFNGEDGSNSAAGVLFDGSGNLYGTTSFGPGPYGLVFELKKPSGKVYSWTETALHLFQDGPDGAYPTARLIFDSTGNLCGTALGGVSHRGVVFRLKPPKRGSSWPFTVLYNLTGSPDGDHPTAGLVSDGRGNLYSTTDWGGTGQSCQGGCGTVFEVSP